MWNNQHYLALKNPFSELRKILSEAILINACVTFALPDGAEKTLESAPVISGMSTQPHLSEVKSILIVIKNSICK